MTFRTKLMLIAATTAVAFGFMIAGNWLMNQRELNLLANVDRRLVPRLELGPRLELQFERLRQGLQDSVAAQDLRTLDATVAAKDAIVATLQSAAGAVDPSDAEAARRAVEEYHATARDVSRRLIARETGEGLLDAMSRMQAKQVDAEVALKRAGSVERAEIAEGFASVRRSTESGARFRLTIGFGCFALVIGLSLWVNRGMIRSLAQISDGFASFATGDFGRSIRIESRDELAKVAHEANQMAASLSALARQRDREDWLKAGLAGLSDELRGELTPPVAAERAVRFLAQRLGAVAGALYLLDEDRVLQLAAHYAFDAQVVSSQGGFRIGEGLVGQAALTKDILVVDSPPADYVKVRSGLGDALPTALVFLALEREGTLTGVLELGFFRPFTSEARQLLDSVRDALALALEGAQSRAALAELLRQTSEQAARLAVQEEELRLNNQSLEAQQEELRQTNVELGAQQRALREANVELEAQKEELRQANVELEMQRQTLTDQNLQLEEAHERLQRQAEELAKVSSYKSTFLANMSHELRTPLNSILLLSQMLAENKKKNLTQKQVEECLTIYASGKDLLDLINQVLDLSKIEAGRQVLDVRPVAVTELAQHLGRMFTPLAADRGLELVIEVAADLPPVLTTDGHRLERILVNLLGNAIKFTPAGEVALRVGRPAPDVALPNGLLAEQTIAFAVSDTGIGIAESSQEVVFRPFEQVDARTDRRFGGTGLGLSIARESAELLGGTLRLVSAPGKGSTFTCYLPQEYREPKRDGDAAKEELSARLRSTRNSRPVVDAVDAIGRGDQVLIIEDDPVFAEQLSELIRERNLEALVANSGELGLELARKLRPRGIVLDVTLPDIDGWAVMNRLRSDPITTGIPVHFVSALDATERGLALGAVGYLVKPASRQDLAAVIQALAPSAELGLSNVLVVEDDMAAAGSLVSLLRMQGIDVTHVGSAAAAFEALDRERYSCMLLDLGLPDMDGLEVLEALKTRGAAAPPIVVHTGRSLTKEEARRIDEYAEAIVLKGQSSESRLVDEIRLFLRHVGGKVGHSQSPPAPTNGAGDPLAGSHLLLADDDMRTVYALSAFLRSKGAQVLVADTGRAALNLLQEHPEVQLILMDIMMPEMDGYEAIRQVRAQDRHKRLPIIALTARAMKGERERCLEAGATDYLSKPVDANRVLTAVQQLLRSTNAS